MIDEGLAKYIFQIARCFCCEKGEIQQREVELWIEDVGPHSEYPNMTAGIMEFYQAVIDEGLTDLPLDYVRKFVIGG